MTISITNLSLLFTLAFSGGMAFGGVLAMVGFNAGFKKKL